METCNASSRTVDSRISSIRCFPLNIATWRKHLSCHPDRDFTDYILSGIQNGFRLGINPEATGDIKSPQMPQAPGDVGHGMATIGFPYPGRRPVSTYTLQ